MSSPSSSGDASPCHWCDWGIPAQGVNLVGYTLLVSFSGFCPVTLFSSQVQCLFIEAALLMVSTQCWVLSPQSEWRASPGVCSAGIQCGVCLTHIPSASPELQQLMKHEQKWCSCVLAQVVSLQMPFSNLCSQHWSSCWWFCGCFSWELKLLKSSLFCPEAVLGECCNPRVDHRMCRLCSGEPRRQQVQHSRAGTEQVAQPFCSDFYLWICKMKIAIL